MQKSFREVMVLWYFSEDNSLMATCKEGGPPMQLQRRGPNSPSPSCGLALRNFKSWPYYYCQRNKYCASVFDMSRIFYYYYSECIISRSRQLHFYCINWLQSIKTAFWITNQKNLQFIYIYTYIKIKIKIKTKKNEVYNI